MFDILKFVCMLSRLLIAIPIALVATCMFLFAITLSTEMSKGIIQAFYEVNKEDPLKWLACVEWAYSK